MGGRREWRRRARCRGFGTGLEHESATPKLPGTHGARVVPVVPASISAASNEAAPAANGAHAHPVAGPAAHSPAGVPAAQPVEKSE